MSLSIDVLRLRDFRLLFFSRVFGLMSLQAQAVVVGWQVYSLTKDTLMLGLAGLTEAIPAIACALFAGHIVDNGRPHRIFLICLSALTLNTFILFLFAGGVIPVEKNHILIFIFSGIFISGLARSFIMPCGSSMLSRLVSRPHIPAATAWLNSGFQIAAISGSAIAGLIYGGYGVKAAWMLPASFIAISLLLMANIGKQHRIYRSREHREPAFKSIKAGWAFMLSNNLLLSIMALDMFAVLFGGAISMLPAFADQILHTDSKGLGILRAAPAVGAIITALFLALRPLKRVRAVLLIPVVAGFGFSIIGLGFSTTFWVSILCLISSGVFDSISMVMRSTLMQLLTPDAMRGRVSSVNSMFIISSNEIGAFESGVAARLLGLSPSIIFGGCCTLLVAAATFYLSPKLRKAVIYPDEVVK